MWERLQRLARARLVKGKARVNRSKARVPGVFWATSHRATARCGNGSSVIGTRRRGPLRERRQVLPGHEKRRQVGLKVARHLPANPARPSPGPARAAPQPTAPPHRQPHRSNRACWGPPTHGAPPRLHRGTGAGRGGPVLRRVRASLSSPRRPTTGAAHGADCRDSAPSRTPAPRGPRRPRPRAGAPGRRPAPRPAAVMLGSRRRDPQECPLQTEEIDHSAPVGNRCRRCRRNTRRRVVSKDMTQYCCAQAEDRRFLSNAMR